MKEIALTQGQVVLIDDEDYPLVGGHRWWAQKVGHTFYAGTSVRKADGRRTTLQMHRLIMPPPDGLQVDHINGEGLDNRRANLRIASRAENQRNQRLHSNSTTGLKGVSRHKTSNTWQACIKVNRKTQHLGCFLTAEDAYAAYCAASVKYHGEFGRTG